MSEKCFCHIKDRKTGEIYAVKDKQAREDIRKLTDNVGMYSEDIRKVNDRIDNIISNDSQTDGNDELIDIRLAADGTRYDTAGEAVRSQVNALHGVIDAIENNIGEVITPMLVKEVSVNATSYTALTTVKPGHKYLALFDYTKNSNTQPVALGLLKADWTGWKTTSGFTSIISAELTAPEDFSNVNSMLYVMGNTVSHNSITVYLFDVTGNEDYCTYLKAHGYGVIGSLYNSSFILKGDTPWLDVTKWTGKKWVAIGDSITIGANSYVNFVAASLGLDVTNLGISGANANRMRESIINESSADYTAARKQAVIDADLITIYGFANDYYPGAPAIGSLYNSEAGSYTHNVKALIETVLQLNPTAKIIIIGCHNIWDSYRPGIYEAVNGTSKIADYIEALDKIAAYYGLPFINMYHDSGINEYSAPIYLADNCHPTAAGHERIANIIINYLK